MLSRLTIVSPSQQVANYLRGEILRGAWSGAMPGAPLLAADLGVDRKTIDAALRLLEDEGLLEAQGACKRRKILPQGGTRKASLRVAILVDEISDRRMDYMVELQHELEEAGHSAFFTEPYRVEMGM